MNTLVQTAILSSFLCGVFSVYQRSLLAQKILSGLGVSIAFACSFLLYVIYSTPCFIPLYTWFINASTSFNLAFYIDDVVILMLMMVSLIALLIHIYSYYYMVHDKQCGLFLSYIPLFVCTMFILLLASHALVLFFAWELVGVWSYLLIGFWHEKELAEQGSFQAFIVNRLADTALLLGFILLFHIYGSLDYSFLNSVDTIPVFHFFGHSIALNSIALCCILFGVMGKSAQFPLHLWLPDSMAGPTPASALIHAATMVTVGIYLIFRLQHLFNLDPFVQNIILVVGSFTAFFGSCIAVTQHDIKRTIAFSTISQLGYMVAGLGASAYKCAIFHLMTHAFFKALLFLAAGVISFSLAYEQDMRKMGGLRQRLPILFLCFMAASLSLAGIPPFSGFFSKESIIDAVNVSPLVMGQYAYFLLLMSTWVTAFYITRLVCKIFLEPPSSHVKWHFAKPALAENVVFHIILLIFAVFSVIAGVFLYPFFMGKRFDVILMHSFTQKPVYLSMSGICFAILLSLKDLFITKKSLFITIKKWMQRQCGLEYMVKLLAFIFYRISLWMAHLDKHGLDRAIMALCHGFLFPSLRKVHYAGTTYVTMMLMWIINILAFTCNQLWGY